MSIASLKFFYLQTSPYIKSVALYYCIRVKSKEKMFQVKSEDLLKRFFDKIKGETCFQKILVFEAELLFDLAQNLRKNERKTFGNLN